MKISIEVTGTEERLLTDTARRLNVPADLLAAAAVRDLVGHAAPDFDAAVSRVLDKNRELYERLR